MFVEVEKRSLAAHAPRGKLLVAAAGHTEAGDKARRPRDKHQNRELKVWVLQVAAAATVARKG